MKTLCGFRPTGQLHIGHYFAVIKPGLAGADILIAEYHAPECTADDVANVLQTLYKFGQKITSYSMKFLMLNFISVCSI